VINFESLTGEKTDQQLWQRIRAGDEQAFTNIFERYHRTLYNYGSKLSTNSAIIEDAVQDVFIDVWRLRNNLTENVTSVKFYLYRSPKKKNPPGSGQISDHRRNYITGRSGNTIQSLQFRNYPDR
jgi:hypothetical protein